MFKHLTLQERLQIAEQENARLRGIIREYEDALIEVAEIVAANEEVIQEVQNG